jgi:hypothetical protein
MHRKLVDIEGAPAFDKTCSPFCDSSRSTNPFSEDLLYVPHYRLPNIDNFDQAAVSQEINRLNEQHWAPYNNDVLNKRGAGLSSYWSATFLRNFINDPSFGFGETKDYLQLMNKEGDHSRWKGAK